MESDPEHLTAAGQVDLAGAGTHSEVVDLIEPLRRYVRARVPQEADREDVVQETLTRVLELGREPALTSSLGYAIVVARHLIADRSRESVRFREQAHRLVEVRHAPGPEPIVLAREDEQALRAALASLPQAQRDLLMQHVLDERPVAELSGDRSEGSRAAQLARTRTRLRLDYVLALRAITLPTARCRPVLLALSARDTRRQLALRAGQHLLTCAPCAEVAPALLKRRRGLAAVLPWLGLGPLLALLRRWLTQAPLQSAAAMTAVVAAAGTGGVVWAHTVADRPPAARAIPVPAVTAPASPSVSARLFQVGDRRAVSGRDGALTALAGRKVSGLGVPVVAVPADEGFWIADATGGRVWVQLDTHGGESKVSVKAGDTVTFTATVVLNDDRFARRVGVDAAEGAALLTREGAHLSLSSSALQVRPRKQS